MLEWLGHGLAFLATPYAVTSIGCVLLFLGVCMGFRTYMIRRLASFIECGRLRFPAESFHIRNVRPGSVRDVYTHLGDYIVVHPVTVRRVSARWRVIYIRFSPEASYQGGLKTLSGWVTAVPQCCHLEEIRFHRTAFGAALELIAEAAGARSSAWQAA